MQSPKFQIERRRNLRGKQWQPRASGIRFNEKETYTIERETNTHRWQILWAEPSLGSSYTKFTAERAANVILELSTTNDIAVQFQASSSSQIYVSPTHSTDRETDAISTSNKLNIFMTPRLNWLIYSARTTKVQYTTTTSTHPNCWNMGWGLNKQSTDAKYLFFVHPCFTIKPLLVRITCKPQKHHL